MLALSNSVDLFTRQIKNFMTDDYITIDHEQTIGIAIKQIQSKKKSSILVIKEHKLCGIITEQDIVRKIIFSTDPNTVISKIMNQPVTIVYEEDLLFHAVGKMRKNKFRHLPVIDMNSYPVGMIDMQTALTAELGVFVNQIDSLTYDEKDIDGLKKIKKYQSFLANTLIAQNIHPGDISYLLSFLNNVIYRRSIRDAEERIKEKKILNNIPAYCVLTMGSGGRMESFLHPDQDNGIIYEDSNEDPKKVDLYFLELSKKFTKTLDDCGIPFCKGDLMATNILWRKSITDWKKQIDLWTKNMVEQNLRYIDMLYDFRSVFGKPELADELRLHLLDKLQNKNVLKFLYKSEESTTSGLNFFGGFILEKEDEENIGMLNLKHTGTLPLVESVRLYSIKYQIDKVSTTERLESLHEKGVFNKHDFDFFKNAFRFLSDILLRNQVIRAKQGKKIQNFIDPSKLLSREKQVLKMYLKKIKDLKEKARGDFGEEYF